MISMATFDDWYQEIQGFSLRAEYLSCPAEELRAAFDAGGAAEREKIRELIRTINTMRQKSSRQHQIGWSMAAWILERIYDDPGILDEIRDRILNDDLID